jgi:hypothetical protein
MYFKIIIILYFRVALHPHTMHAFFSTALDLCMYVQVINERE